LDDDFVEPMTSQADATTKLKVANKAKAKDQ